MFQPKGETVSIAYGNLPGPKPKRGFGTRRRLQILREIAENKRNSGMVRMNAVKLAEEIINGVKLRPDLSRVMQKVVADLLVQPGSSADLLAD